MEGQIEIEGKGSALKPGTRVRPGDRIIIKTRARFVSRAGDKLDAVLERWQLEIKGMEALDAGASTGGFTQVLLERGASRVIALDVGRGQLHWDLRRDPRVIVLEGVNLRHLRPEDLPYQPQLITADLSFISLSLVFPVFAVLLQTGRYMIALIKPQFEAGRGKVGKKGVVRDPEVHRQTLAQVIQAAAKDGFGLLDLAPSAIRGADGNIEFFGWFARDGGGMKTDYAERIERAVGEAWGKA
jgi:23S rRNA (cytidine1920-2'-O)/16S rRNA (cytidine1409-2'-O)-methyltransferase